MQLVSASSISVVVERPRGSCEGWHGGDATGELVLTEYYEKPVPVNYGFAPEWLNPADGDPLDVILLDDQRMRPGETLASVPAGVLWRQDGDHKLLVIPESGATRPVLLNETTKQRVSSWWAADDQPIGWGGADAVPRLLGQCRKK
jgi:inorganic pyrophosphatase